ncbi:MarR family transcriptional regulator [Rhodococcus sp. D2-41]|uniref:MarR family transcriptional regulator n=1 Tax=Speluncibacter jeojiensis TaxID=2710754 RepID=A0A9X4M485_9ACTN|nr:MarR family transcriptional regulator [Rhodococcus sp. D2-41]MDG3010394.1 MarR family transcriptional regulator [Rhodococcus sp. D2-41]MDG3014131.1 MarR family transcriptional regulator [Corynebacteriales bacterium D3-21]
MADGVDADEADAEQVAAELRLSIGLLVRRLRQVRIEGDLTLPENSALARLDRDGPTTSSALAKIEQISPQSMGATVAALLSRGLLEQREDPADGRRRLLWVTEAGRQALGSRRNARTQQLAQVLTSGFTQDELRRLAAAAPLIERLAQEL